MEHEKTFIERFSPTHPKSFDGGILTLSIPQAIQPPTLTPSLSSLLPPTSLLSSFHFFSSLYFIFYICFYIFHHFFNIYFFHLYPLHHVVRSSPLSWDFGYHPRSWVARVSCIEKSVIHSIGSI